MAAPSEPYLFTGFPGFIGVRLLPRLLELAPLRTFVCLVQEKFLDAACTAIRAMETAHPHTRGRVTTVTGDITKQRLGLSPSDAQALASTLRGAYHLAAVYDLTVRRDVGMAINVSGTKHVLELLEDARNLDALHYVSTAYVSGAASGTYRETDLDVGQKFKNYYEETKFLAEVEVAKRGLPFVVYRPGVVVGDSKTGETAKFDGPYFVMSAMMKLPSPGLFPRVGLGSHAVNVVPVDFVVEALSRLSTNERSLGRTYHLTDPAPIDVSDMIGLFGKTLGKTFIQTPVPLFVAKAFFAPRAVQRFFGLPTQALDYFAHPCRYDATQATADLAPFGASCPRMADYVGALASFFVKERERLGAKAMI
jgi:thioester reductase-like protein